MADAPITFFIPLGSGRQNAGLTYRAESTDELLAVMDDLLVTDETEESKLSQVLNNVATINAAVALVFPEATPTPVKTAAKHPQATSSPSDAPSCTHGQMSWKSGISKAGNEYKGWFCNAPYGQTQCKPQFVK